MSMIVVSEEAKVQYSYSCVRQSWHGSKYSHCLAGTGCEVLVLVVVVAVDFVVDIDVVVALA